VPDPLSSSEHRTLQFRGLHAGFIVIVIYMAATPLLPKNFSQQNQTTPFNSTRLSFR
jgi:hypothetical protein